MRTQGARLGAPMPGQADLGAGIGILPPLDKRVRGESSPLDSVRASGRAVISCFDRMLKSVVVVGLLLQGPDHDMAEARPREPRVHVYGGWCRRSLYPQTGRCRNGGLWGEQRKHLPPCVQSGVH